MAGPWPSNPTPIPTGNVENDADSLTAARADIENLILRFNDVLASISPDDVPLTDNNSGELMSKVAPFTDGNVPVLAGGDGSLADSTRPITTSNTLPDGNLAITDAIKAYVLANGGGGYPLLSSVTSSHIQFQTSASSTVMLQWGKISNPSTGQSYFFQTPFTSAPYSFVGMLETSSVGYVSLQAGDLSATSFQVTVSVASTFLHWFAIGFKSI